jgi:hypothetical protein
VDDDFHLSDVEAAQAFLREFGREARRGGHGLFHRGAVTDLQVVQPGKSYRGLVQDGPSAYRVELTRAGETWSTACQCHSFVHCAHIFAAMYALLAEHRAAVVRQLSTGQGISQTPAGVAKKTPDPHLELSLLDRVRSGLGRQVTKTELRFLTHLRDLYQRCARTHQIAYSDIQGLGFFQLSGYGWIFPKIWPAFPDTEYEFWLYLANFLNQQGAEIPEFMVPVTNLSLIEERIARWRRAAEVEKWKKSFSSLDLAEDATLAQGELDLRLIIEGTAARLQLRRPDQAEFEPFRQQQYRQMEADHRAGRVNFTMEGEVLWQLFTSAVLQGMKLDLDSYDTNVIHVLGRILRTRALQDRVVDASGKVVTRFSEPLRWEVSPAETLEDDYRFKLVQQDGTPAPPILCVVPGRPILYLTATGVFPGPGGGREVLEPSGENLIPAAAIESADGVAFLDALGVELPPRLKDRVRKLPWEVSISCALQPVYHGSDVDECAVAVEARAEDGRKQTWDGFGWTAKNNPQRKSKKKDGAITLYDAATLNLVPALLQPLNLKPDRYSDKLVIRLTKNFAETFVAWLKTVPPTIQVHLDAELASLTSGDVVGRVKLEVTEAEIDWFDLRVVLDVADTTLTAEEIKLLLNAKGGYVRLRGKGWRRLQYDLDNEENDQLARLGLSPRELSAEPQRLHALQLADPAAKRFMPAQQVEQIHRRTAELKARVAPDLPTGITAQLRPYQLEGFHFLAYLTVNRFGGILADDMGLGKTLQTLAWLVWLREQDPRSSEASDASKGAAAGAPTLVICPKSVMDNWRAEALRFAPGLLIKVWSAGELPAFGEALNTADLHVLNYSQLRSLGESLGAVSWLAVVLDEGQYIKNPNSQTAQIARSLRARYRLVLSGTPIENRLLDLWSLMAFTMPGVLGSRAAFARLYDGKGDPLARRRLAARVRPFLLRRTKAQVAKDLPDRIEEDLFCEIEGEQRALYRAELKAAQQLLLSVKTQKELARQQFNFLTSLLRLRQICCHPRLLQPDCTAPSAKTESLLEQLEPLMEEGQKVLVFSQFVQMLDLLRPQIDQRQWPVFYLAGQTENRGDLVRRFQETEGPAVFLISLKAGGFGLNLTAASYVILFDPWWNPAVENQAIDRTHRIGQTSKVMAYRLLIKDSIEEKIRDLQKQKSALAEDVFGEEKFAQSLTVEDLRFLFSD